MALTKIPTHMLFSGAASEDLSIDSDTLFIDSSANRVGIANNSPSVALDVTGAAKISSTLDLTSHLDMPDSAKIKLGTGDDLEIYHDASDSYIKDTGTGALEIWGSGINIRGTDGGYLGRFTSQSWAGLFHNNTEKLRTTSSGIQVAGNIANSSGDMTIDVAGDIVLDAGGQNWYFDDDGTRVFSIAQVSSDVYIGTEVSDKDMIFRVNDGGSVITALTLDGSDAGSAKFNGPNLNITADDARLLVEEADGTNIGWFGDITGAGVGGCFLYNHGGTATVQIRADNTAGFINNGANFGIGTSSPSAPLQVAASPSDTVGTVGISLKDVDNAIEFGLRLDATSKDLHIDRYYSGSWYNHMSFDRSTGNVGIGITPTHNFNLSASGAVEARFASTDNDTYLQISSDTDEGQDSILQFLAGTGAKGSITYDHNTTADSQKMIFKTGDNANDALYIYGDGTVKVGLGGSGGDLVLQPQAKLYLDAGGNTYIQESAGDVIDIYTGGTQRLRLNSSGATLDGNLSMTSSVIYASQIYVNDRVGHRDDASTFINFDTDRIEFATNGEAMRIDSSGGLLIAKTSQFSPTSKLVVSAGATGGTTPACSFQANTSTSSGSIVVFYKGNGGEVASIGMSNLNAGTSVSYNTGSDARWKDVTGEARGLEVINNLNPVAFNWKETGTADEGLIAQEVQEHMPNVVHEGNNGYLQMDYSKLVTPLIKALQEADDKIDALEARIATLESS
jgi:hypothetical protein